MEWGDKVKAVGMEKEGRMSGWLGGWIKGTRWRMLFRKWVRFGGGFACLGGRVGERWVKEGEVR